MLAEKFGYLCYFSFDVICCLKWLVSIGILLVCVCSGGRVMILNVKWLSKLV